MRKINRAFFGKLMTMLVRNALVTHVIHYAYEIVSGIQGASLDELTTPFYERCKVLVSKVSTRLFVIQKDNLIRAMEKTDYYNKHKLIFLGFNIDPLVDMHTNYAKILLEAQEALDHECEVRDSAGKVVPKKVADIMKKILTREYIYLGPRLIHNNNEKKDVTDAAMEALVAFGFGTTEIEKSANGASVLFFRKISHAALTRNPKLLKVIQSMGLDLTKTINSWMLAEAAVNSQRPSQGKSKRPITEVTIVRIQLHEIQKKIVKRVARLLQ